MRLCSVEGCGKRHWVKGFCVAHYQANRYANEPGFRERHLAQARARYAKNAERREDMLAERRLQYAECPERRRRQRAAADRWAKSNPEAVAALRKGKNARRATRLRGVCISGIQQAIESGMVDRPCAKCAAPGPSHIDHIIPLSWVDGCPAVAEVLGHAWAYQPLCNACNPAKGARWLECYVPTGDIGD